MSDYALVGKKGTGKSSGAVRMMRDAMIEGLRVATNLNLRVDKLVPRDCRSNVQLSATKQTYNKAC